MIQPIVDTKLLQLNVMYNYETVVSMMHTMGYEVQTVETVRYQERQTELNAEGKAPAKVTFHRVGCAIDVCEKIHGYSRPEFFRAFGLVAKKVGFTWGGDWKSYDAGHIQWDNHGAITGTMILQGTIPPAMPLYERVFNDNIADSYAANSVAKAVALNVLQGDDLKNLKLHSSVTRQDLCVILDRLGLLDK